MFHAFLDVFSKKNGYQKNTNNRNPEPPTPLFLFPGGNFPKFYQFFDAFSYKFSSQTLF